MNGRIFGLNEGEERFLETQLGEACSVIAQNQIEGPDTPNNRVKYCELYKETFQRFIDFAVKFKETSFIQQALDLCQKHRRLPPKQTLSMTHPRKGFLDPKAQTLFLQFLKDEFPSKPIESDLFNKDFIPAICKEFNIDQPKDQNHHTYLYQSGSFLVTEEEYQILDEAFGKLCHAAAWDAVKRFPTYLEEDVFQEIFIAALRSAAQYKRKRYYTQSEVYLKNYPERRSSIVKLWLSSFKSHVILPEEEMNFISLMDEMPTTTDKPSVRDPLVLDANGRSYIKTCLWNQQRLWMKTKAKEHTNRRGEISLSEHDQWVGMDISSTHTPRELVESTRETLFANIRDKLSQIDERATRTYDILIDPQNDKEIFSESSKYKVKVNGVRRRTKQSYKAIKKDLEIIESVSRAEMDRELATLI